MLSRRLGNRRKHLPWRGLPVAGLWRSLRIILSPPKGFSGSGTRTCRPRRSDPAEKLEAIKDVVPPTLKRGHFEAPDKLIASLQGAGLC